MPEPADRYSFVARFGEALLRGGVATIPAALYRYQAELHLSAPHVWFVSAILSYKWDDRMPYPSLVTLAEHSGISRQMLHRYQKELIEAGWLHVIHRHTPEGGKTSNFFDFSILFAKLVELLYRDKVGDVNPSLHGDVNASGHGDDNPSLHRNVKPGLHEEEPRKEEKKKGRKQFGAPFSAPSRPRVRNDDPEKYVKGKYGHLVLH